ncbi:MAG: protein kinase domain-containing protein, partial [Lentisphaeria bacterium]
MKSERLELSNNDVKLADQILESMPDSSEKMLQITQRLLNRERQHGRYIVRDQLARGGMGVIYTVYDQDLRRTTAMKVLPPQILHQEPKISSFIEESRITAQLEHPNIVPIHEIGVIEGSSLPYYTMKLIDGEPLTNVIRMIAREDPEYVQHYTRHRLLDIFLKVCNAVAYAHSHGVIHRDIKPENIMVGKFGEVLLMDWGLAKYVDADDNTAFEEAEDSSQIIEHNPSRTEDGVIKGSLAYIAPEQVLGDSSAIDKKTDIFLLGGTLYQIFTHLPPYEGENTMDVLQRAERCQYEVPSKRNPRAQIPKALERIILHAMAPTKDKRYESCQDLIDDVEAFVAGRRSGGIRQFQVDQEIIKAGDESKETFVIISGKAEVHRNVNGRNMTIAEIGAGEIVGEMAGIGQGARTATVTATEDTEALIITYELMLDELRKLPPWMEKIVFSLADRVRINSSYLHPLLLENRIFPLVNQLFLIYAGAHAQAAPGTPISYPLKDVVDEVTMNLGLDMARTTKVIDILAEEGLCVNVAEQLSIPSLQDFALFNDYCRCKMDINTGVKKIKEI